MHLFLGQWIISEVVVTEPFICIGMAPFAAVPPALFYGPGEPADPLVTVFDKSLALG